MHGAVCDISRWSLQGEQVRQMWLRQQEFIELLWEVDSDGHNADFSVTRCMLGSRTIKSRPRSSLEVWFNICLPFQLRSCSVNMFGCVWSDVASCQIELLPDEFFPKMASHPTGSPVQAVSLKNKLKWPVVHIPNQCKQQIQNILRIYYKKVPQWN